MVGRAGESPETQKSFDTRMYATLHIMAESQKAAYGPEPAETVQEQIHEEKTLDLQSDCGVSQDS